MSKINTVEADDAINCVECVPGGCNEIIMIGYANGSACIKEWHSTIENVCWRFAGAYSCRELEEKEEISQWQKHQDWLWSSALY